MALLLLLLLILGLSFCGSRQLRIAKVAYGPNCGHLHMGECPRGLVSTLGSGIRRADARTTKNALGRTSANCAGELFVIRYASSKKVHSSKRSIAGNPTGKTRA